MQAQPAHPKIQRTATGYKLGTLETNGLPPRASQALLLSAEDCTLACAAKAMGCTPRNVAALLDKLRAKTGAASKAGLITRAFQNGWLRFTAIVLACFLGLGGGNTASQLLNLQIANNDDPLRPRSGRRQHHRRRKGEWHWDADTNQLQQS